MDSRLGEAKRPEGWEERSCGQRWGRAADGTERDTQKLRRVISSESFPFAAAVANNSII